MLGNLGYRPIVEFKEIPTVVYYNPKLSVTLSVTTFETQAVVKAAKHFFIRAMETKGEAGIYSRLQEITKFTEYLKQNIEDWHLQEYYISNITPRIALNNFRFEPQLQKYLSKWEEKSQVVGQVTEEEEAVMREKLELLKRSTGHDEAIAAMDRTLQEIGESRRQQLELDSKLKGAASILNEWIEKGHAIALVWTISTGFHVCEQKDLKNEVDVVERELSKIWTESVKAKAHQQGLWLEEIREPQYVIHAEYVGLFHPEVQELYKTRPELSKFAKELEHYFNARLQRSIQRIGYSEESSTAIAEPISTFLRQVEKIEEAPSKLQLRIPYEKIKSPIYLGLIAVAHEDYLQSLSAPFVFDLNTLTRHVLITGTSGSGKTRVGQLVTEAASMHVPVVILDPVGEFTGLIHPNPDAKKEREFRLERGRAYSPVIYTLEDDAVSFQANILKKPVVTGDRLISQAEDIAIILSELAGDLRFRDIFREVLLDGWERGDLTFEQFMTMCRTKAAQKRTGIKLDRLTPYKPLMSLSNFNIQSLLENKITIFTFNSTRFTESQKLMFMWFILRELSNYFLNQLHSDELKLLVIIDEAHRFYSEAQAKSPAKVLETLNAEGRGRGLGMVVITQTIKDLPEIFTQADTRILLKIAEGEIQSYAQKFNAELARRLRLLGAREGYVFLGPDQFYCKFRPTLSNPKGVLTKEELRQYSASNKAFQTSLQILMTDEKHEPPKSNQMTFADTDLEKTAIEILEKNHGISVSRLQNLLRIKGRQTITNLVNSMESKKLIITKPMANKRLIYLVTEKQPLTAQNSFSAKEGAPSEKEKSSL